MFLFLLFNKFQINSKYRNSRLVYRDNYM